MLSNNITVWSRYLALKFNNILDNKAPHYTSTLINHLIILLKKLPKFGKLARLQGVFMNLQFV
jgi:hypothetical protein